MTALLLTKDTFGNPLNARGQSVTFSLGAGTSTVAISTVNDLGDGSYTATLTGITSGTPATLSATVNGGTVTSLLPTLQVIPGNVSALVSTVSASPASLVANGSSSATVTNTLRDANLNPVSGKTVTLSSSRGATDTISAASGMSSVNGVVTFAVTSSTVGTPVFTATDTTDSITVTQTATVTFKAPLSLAPATYTLAVGNSKSTTASGGEAPYTFSMVSGGGGSINSVSGLFTAPGTAGTSTVQVTDALSATAQATFTINPALSLTPASITLTTNSGQTYAYGAQNGVPAISYSLTSGPGKVGSSSGIYTPSSAAGLTTLKAQDSIGNSVTSQIQSIKIRTNGTVNAAVTDGTSGYLGGSFTAVNPYEAPNALVVDATSGNPVLACDWKSGFNNQVNVVVVSGRSLYVGDWFSTYRGGRDYYFFPVDLTSGASQDP